LFDNKAVGERVNGMLGGLNEEIVMTGERDGSASTSVRGIDTGRPINAVTVKV
jgi:hypothetical protein